MKGLCNISGNKEEIIGGKIIQHVQNYGERRKQGYCYIPKLTGISTCKITFDASRYATVSLDKTWGTQISSGQILTLPCTVWWIHKSESSPSPEGSFTFELLPDEK